MPEVAADVPGLALGLWREEVRAASARLARMKPGQRDAFEALAPRVAGLYEILRGRDAGEFLLPKWAAINVRLESTLLPRPPFDFTRRPAIRDTMFAAFGGRFLRETMAFLESRLPRERLKELLLEDTVGDPELLAVPYLSSHNSVVQLLHLLRFAAETRCDTAAFKTVVEWGGGYGLLAKIFRRQCLVPNTYLIVDSPIFSCLQWLYLAAALGEETVHLLSRPQDRIEPGRINLIPLGLLEEHRLRADLFVSAWALEEGSQACVDYVLQRDWFGAERLLLAYLAGGPRLPAAAKVDRMAERAGAKKIELGGDCYYAFR